MGEKQGSSKRFSCIASPPACYDNHCPQSGGIFPRHALVHARMKCFPQACDRHCASEANATTCCKGAGGGVRVEAEAGQAVIADGARLTNQCVKHGNPRRPVVNSGRLFLSNMEHGQKLGLQLGITRSRRPVSGAGGERKYLPSTEYEFKVLCSNDSNIGLGILLSGD